MLTMLLRQFQSELTVMRDYQRTITDAVREAGYPDSRERRVLHRIVCARLASQLAAQGLNKSAVEAELSKFDETFEQLDEQFQTTRDFGRYAGFQNPWPDQQQNAQEGQSKGSLVKKRIGRSVWHLAILLVIIAALGAAVHWY